MHLRLQTERNGFCLFLCIVHSMFSLQERLTSLIGVPPSSPLYRITNNAFERSLVLLSRMPRLWIMYLEFLSSQPYVTKTRRCFDRALQSLPITQHSRIWNIYIPWVDRIGVPVMSVAVYRRYLMLEPSKVGAYVELLKRLERYDEAACVLAKTLNEDAGGSLHYVEGKSSVHELWWVEFDVKLLINLYAGGVRICLGLTCAN